MSADDSFHLTLCWFCMNPHDIEAFVAAVETGSIVGAAARLHLTQPAITRRIQNLEGAIGTPLLDRRSKPLRPTPTGRQAYELGRRVLRAVQDMAAVTQTGEALSGEFRVGVSPLLSEVALVDPVDAIRTGFPKLAIRVSTAWSTDLLGRVEASRIDAAAVCLPIGHAPPADLDRHLLSTEPVLVIAARRSPFPARLRLRDLGTTPWILSPDGCAFRRLVRQAFEASRLPFEIAGEALGSDLQLSLVARGVGLGLVTERRLRLSPLTRQLRNLDVVDFRPEMQSWFVHPPEPGRLRPVIDRFRSSLAGALGPSPGRSRSTRARSRATPDPGPARPGPRGQPDIRPGA
jgi:DNA-binding transcriptional LysR family regulator